MGSLLEMIAIKPICEAIGIDHKRQTQKIKANPQFSWGHMSSTESDGIILNIRRN